MRRFTRNLSSRAPEAAEAVTRGPRPLTLRPPVEGRRAAVATPDDHPLWQFFREKQALREPSKVQNVGSSWSVPQLRRKSFDDLHTLWYVCLKEWNALSRESSLIHYYQSRPGRETEAKEPSRFDEVIQQIQQSMKNIRHVLAERYHGFQRGQLELEENRGELLEEFSREFLEADSNSDAEVAGMMERFQYAFYGINPHLDDNIPSEEVIRGLYDMAKLKLERYASDQNEVTSVDDIREAFLLFTCEHTPEGVAEAIETIKEVRQAEPVEDEVKALAGLMFAARPAVEADEAEIAEPIVEPAERDPKDPKV